MKARVSMAVTALVFGLLGMTGVLHAATQTIYSDTLVGSGALSGVAATTANGVVGGTAGATWISGATKTASGVTYTGGNRGFLPFTPQSGFIYTLTATVQLAGASDWVSLGFANVSTSGQWHVTGSKYAWALVRNSGGGAPQFFAGSNTNNSRTWSSTASGQQTLIITLDTTGTNWMTYATIGGVSSTTFTYSSNPTSIAYVGFGMDAIGTATVRDFSLTVTTPSPPVSVGGAVSDAAGAVSGASVSYSTSPTGPFTSVTTDSSGAYSFTGYQNTTYYVKAGKTGYRDSTVQTIAVGTSNVTGVNVNLVAIPLIAWDTPVNITSNSPTSYLDVSTEGTYVAGYNPAGAATVNGVAFTITSTYFSDSGFSTNYVGFIGSGTTGDTNYDSLLSAARYNDSAAPATITLSGLTPGSRYLVQLWVDDGRIHQWGYIRTESVDSARILGYEVANYLGQYIIGRFTADAGPQVITLAANGVVGAQSTQFNGVQLRLLPSSGQHCIRGVVLPRTSTIYYSTTSGGSYTSVGPAADGTYSFPVNNNTTYYVKADMSPQYAPSGEVTVPVGTSDVTGVNFTLVPNPTYTIAASVTGLGGTCTPVGVTTLYRGQSQTYAITPNSDYGISGLLIDGAAVIPGATYTFSNVAANHTIAATFGKPVGMVGKSVLTDLIAPNSLITAWGQVRSIALDGSSFVINDGYGDVSVMANGLDLPAGFSTTKFPVVTGWLGADRKIYAQKITGSWLDQYNVSWKTPSMDSLDSMPLSGRLGAGANVWVQDGSIWLYLDHNGAYDEQGRLLKLGCIRLTPVGMTLGTGTNFRQDLDLTTGAISVSQDTFKASLWFAGETLMIETSSGSPRALDISYGSWRYRDLSNVLVDMNTTGNYTRDQITADTSGFFCVHRNSDYTNAGSVTGRAAGQGIASGSVWDPTTQRVFGGALAVDGGITQPTASVVQWQYWADGKAWTGRTTSAATHTIAIRLAARLNANPQQWRTDAQAALAPAAVAAARADEHGRWTEFWSRSHVIVNGSASQDDPGWLVGRNYQLFRYMLACNRDGELPLLFNGGIFTTDNKPGRITGNNNNELPISGSGPITPDFRRWMYCHFMSQNERWLGWPNLANGDTDLYTPSLKFYRDRSATAAARAATNGAQGVVYPEPLDVWGLCCVSPMSNGLCGAGHLTYHFSMMLEQAWMALQAHDALGISLDQDLNWITGTVIFYDSFYRAQCKSRTGSELGTDGKLVIYPSNGLEYAVGATNPVEVVCALQRITASLLALPEITGTLRTKISQIQAEAPDIPTGTRSGVLSILPAKSWESEYNMWEPEEMYAYWPYRLAGVIKPDTLQLARDTWNTVPANRAAFCKQDWSWMANVANMAALGWPSEAKQRAIWKLSNTSAPQARFPAFFGPGHDWLPDHNWGGSGCTGLQEMILAPEPGLHGKLNVFAGWPTDWDVDFKLHAPGPAVVEGTLRGGRVVSLNVTPQSRASDVINWLSGQ